MHRAITPKPHAFIDYAAIAFLALAPTLFTFGGLPATLCYGAAILYLGLCLLTAYPLGVAKVIPFPIHGGVELAMGLFFLLAPFLFGFSNQIPEARNLFLISGVAIAAVWALTDYRASEAPPQRMAARRHV